MISGILRASFDPVESESEDWLNMIYGILRTSFDPVESVFIH